MNQLSPWSNLVRADWFESRPSPGKPVPSRADWFESRPSPGKPVPSRADWFEPTVRGVHAIAVRDRVDRRGRTGRFARVARQYHPDWPEELTAEGWYGLWPVLRALEDSLRNGETVEQVVHDLTAANARAQLQLLCASLELDGHPARALAHANLLLRELCNFGELEVVVNRSRSFEAWIDGIPNDELAWFCGAWLGLAPTALRMLGATDARSGFVLRQRSAAHTRLYFRCEYRR